MTAATVEQECNVYKIAPLEAWQAAVRTGTLEPSAVDARDGFTHLSAPHQVAETARRHFSGQTGLVLVAWRSADLAPILRWEASRGGDLFPHAYGALPVSRALWAEPLASMPDGVPDVERAIASMGARDTGSAVSLTAQSATE